MAPFFEAASLKLYTATDGHTIMYRNARRVSFAGTYQLTDKGAITLLACCPRLTTLELAANSRITKKSIESMVDAKRPVGSALTSLSLVR